MAIFKVIKFSLVGPPYSVYTQSIPDSLAKYVHAARYPATDEIANE